MNSKRLLHLLFAAVLLSGCSLFIPYYTLTIKTDNDGAGYVEHTPDRISYPENTVVVLTAVAAPGWEAAGWTGASTSAGNSAEVVMDANRIVTASFRPSLTRGNPSDGIIGNISCSFAPAYEDSWTFIIYMAGDNNLDPFVIEDLNEMEAGLAECSNENIRIIALADRNASADQLYRIQPGTDPNVIESEVLTPSWAGGEFSMGDPSTLKKLIQYSVDEYPGGHYALILWNHGGGARSINLPVSSERLSGRQICEDVGDSGDSLFLDEVQKAVEEAGVPGGLDFICMDACIMGTIETAYEFRNLARFFTASMASVNASGWDYHDLFGRMKIQPGSSGGQLEALAGLMVDSYRSSASGVTGQSLSSVRLDSLPALKTAVDALAAELYSSGSRMLVEHIRDSSVKFFNPAYPDDTVSRPYYDLGDLCQLIILNKDRFPAEVARQAEDVLAVLGQTVVAAWGGSGIGNYFGTGPEVKRGLSVFFSNGNLLYKGLTQYAFHYWYTDIGTSAEWGPYGFIDFCTSDEDGVVETWREMLEAWYDPYRPPVGYTPGCW